MGSGSTWPHDFRFLDGFLSVVGVVGVEGVSAGVVATAPASPERTDASALSSAAKDRGVMISSGFIVAEAVAAAGVPKREGYMSPGMERKDSAGDASNLTSGEAVSRSHESMSAGEKCNSAAVRGCSCLFCLFSCSFFLRTVLCRARVVVTR